MKYEEPRNSIGVVARRTGLSQHVIRVWERRYSAIRPSRTETRRRLYSDADVDRLRMLHRLTALGHPIGQMAHRPDEELKELLATAEALPAPPRPPVAAVNAERPEAYVEACQNAVLEMDAGALESVLMEACRALSQPVFLDEVVVPLLSWAGDAWQEGEIRIAHEHLLSACVAHQLGEMRNSRPAPQGAPTLLIATPTGQLHELGAALIATVGAIDGWRIVYLGANLPADEIANAAVRVQARAVALSVIFPPDDPHLAREFHSLRKFLPAEIHIIVGGQAAHAYAAGLRAVGACMLADTKGFREALARMRQGQSPAATA